MFVWPGRKFDIVRPHAAQLMIDTSVNQFCKLYGLVQIGPVFENGTPQKQAVGTFDVCLARPKVCATDILRLHVARLMIDTSVNQFRKIWPSVDWPSFLQEVHVD